MTNLENPPPGDSASVPAESVDDEPAERVNWVSAIPFFLAHGIAGLVFVTGITRTALVLFLVLYSVRCFAITAGYHRYFAHRSYKLARVPQFLLALIATTAAQKGPLWWAGHHRQHHRHSDTPDDVHSPQRGFWWSHVGWILVDKHKQTDQTAIRDFAAYPELRFLDRHHDFGPWLLGVASYLIGGWSGLVFGFFGSTVLLWHITFTINSLSHTIGTRRYATNDTSRNNPVLALLTFGEGWHNNHHHYQASARQGFYWWEIDITWYALRALNVIGIVTSPRQPPPEALIRNRIRDGAFDLGMFRARHRRLTSDIRTFSPPPAHAAARPESPARATFQDQYADLHHALSGTLEAAEELGALTRQSARSQLSHVHASEPEGPACA